MGVEELVLATAASRVFGEKEPNYSSSLDGLVPIIAAHRIASGLDRGIPDVRLRS
jgi:hypothetical protein